MESYMCTSTDLVLLVGEGNFSFSRDFMDMNKCNNFPPSNLYSTCYESNVEEFSSNKLENIEALKAAGNFVHCSYHNFYLVLLVTIYLANFL